MLQLICPRPATLRLPAARLFSTARPFLFDRLVPFQKGTPPPFTINRTNSLNIPIYHRIKSGGTKKTTEIKKIEGDAHVLADMIMLELNLETKVNRVTNHIIIKGLHRSAVEQWLCDKGF